MVSSYLKEMYKMKEFKIFVIGWIVLILFSLVFVKIDYDFGFSVYEKTAIMDGGKPSSILTYQYTIGRWTNYKYR